MWKLNIKENKKGGKKATLNHGVKKKVCLKDSFNTCLLCCCCVQSLIFLVQKKEKIFLLL